MQLALQDIVRDRLRLEELRLAYVKIDPREQSLVSSLSIDNWTWLSACIQMQHAWFDFAWRTGCATALFQALADASELLLPSLHSLQVDALVVDRITSDALVKWADRKRRAGKALKNIRFVGLDVDYQDEVEWQGEIRRYIDCVQIMSYQKESLVH